MWDMNDVFEDEKPKIKKDEKKADDNMPFDRSVEFSKDGLATDLDKNADEEKDEKTAVRKQRR